MKYVRKFKTLAEAREKGNNGLESPHVDMVQGYHVSNLKRVSRKKFSCGFDDYGKIINPVLLCTIDVTCTSGGSVYGGGSFTSGTVITIIAQSNSGYSFTQ